MEVEPGRSSGPRASRPLGFMSGRDARGPSIVRTTPSRISHLPSTITDSTSRAWPWCTKVATTRSTGTMWARCRSTTIRSALLPSASQPPSGTPSAR